MDNQQVIKSIWDAARCEFDKDPILKKNVDPKVLREPDQPISIHQKAGLGVDKCLHECVFSKTLDNITVVLICFDNFEKAVNSLLN